MDGIRGNKSGALAPFLTRQKIRQALEARKAETGVTSYSDDASAPRSHRPNTPPETRRGLGGFIHSHERAVTAVMAGIGGMSALSGCATIAHAQPAYDFSVHQTADAKFEAFKAKAEEINAKKATLPYTEIVKLREDLYKAYVSGGGTTGIDVDQDKDGVNLAREILYQTSDTKIDSDGDGMSDKYEIDKGLDPADAMNKGAATIKAWTHGYIPMSNNPLIENNTLLYYDHLIQDRTGVDPATRHEEGRSGIDGGHYFLSSTLDENNAELTTGIDYNGDGVLTPGVKHDFLTPSFGDATFGADGKTDATLSVGWWGHCNDVATAGINFREPKETITIKLNHAFDRWTVDTKYGTFAAEDVIKGPKTTDIKLLSGQTVRLANEDVTHSEKQTIKEITFTPDQLKEITSELVDRGSKFGTDWLGNRFAGRDAVIKLNDGTELRGGLTSSLEDRADVTGDAYITATKFTGDVTMRIFDFQKKEWTDKTFKASEIKSIYAENPRDVNPVDFHLTMLKWIGADKMAGVMDKDPGPHVWNYAFDRYEITKNEVRANDPNTRDFSMNVYFAGNDYPATYTYSLTFENGVPKSGKWDANSTNPDFFWRDRGGAEGYNHDGGKTAVDYKTITELLNKSYAIEDAKAAAAATTPAPTAPVAAPVAPVATPANPTN